MLTKEQWRQKKRRKRNLLLTIVTTLVILILSTVIFMCVTVFKQMDLSVFGFFETAPSTQKPAITEMFLTPNEYSRPQTPLNKVNSIVVHYTANPGTDAEANRNYFENLRISKETSASSHFVIGLDGTIVQCIPTDEISYASNDRNFDTISIECCHPDKTGKFTEDTYRSLVSLTAWLASEYHLDEDDIIRHYDITGKLCPLYFVKHEDAWAQFKKDVTQYIKDNAVSK